MLGRARTALACSKSLNKPFLSSCVDTHTQELGAPAAGIVHTSATSRVNRVGYIELRVGTGSLSIA
jgi:hypothetical protein